MKKLTMTAVIYSCPSCRCTHMDADGACTVESCPFHIRDAKLVDITFEVPDKSDSEG